MSKEVIEALAKIVNVEVSDLTSAIESDESELTFDVAKTFKDEEWRSFETTLKKEKDDEYNKGKDVGTRQFIRDSKETLGLDYEGKDGDMFLAKFREKVINDVGENPDERVTTLSKDLSILRETSTKELATKNKELDLLNTKYNSLRNGSEIRKFVPNAPKGIDVDDAIYIMEKDLSFQKDEEGQRVVISNGEVLKDKTRNPIDWDSAVKDYWVKKEWITKEGGGRGGDGKPNLSDPTKFSKQSELNAYFEEKGINPLSQEARAMMNEAGKKNPEFNFNG
jgi:hypothetical protein